MPEISCKLTVYFREPFWVGVYERTENGQLQACRITFGAEPKDYEVYDFLLQNWKHLQFGSAVTADAENSSTINPKRMQRQIKKQLRAAGVGTKAQQALHLQHTEGKEARKKMLRIEREQEKKQLFAKKQQKRKQKRKGH